MGKMHSFMIIGMIAVTLLLVGCEISSDIASDIVDALGPSNRSASDSEDSKSGSDVLKNGSTIPSNSTLQKANNSPVVTCIDTDGGLNFTLKGMVTVNVNGVMANYTDYCRHGSYEDYLMEFSCGPSGAVMTNQDCRKGCDNNGACW